jgi:acyl-coenzyme A thioesterase PaaI-like protein
MTPIEAQGIATPEAIADYCREGTAQQIAAAQESLAAGALSRLLDTYATLAVHGVGSLEHVASTVATTRFLVEAERIGHELDAIERRLGL